MTIEIVHYRALLAGLFILQKSFRTVSEAVGSRSRPKAILVYTFGIIGLQAGEDVKSSFILSKIPW
jgi:hypothetical protein